ncbi:hypothetical protein ACLKA6_005011 [Drosophila palustris]
MRNYLWRLLLLVACCLPLGSQVKAKPLVSFGLGVQAASRPAYPAYPYTDPHYNNYNYYNGGYYGGTYNSRYPPGYPYPQTYYPAPYSPGYRYGQGGGALDIGIGGIGGLSLTPFLL